MMRLTSCSWWRAFAIALIIGWCLARFNSLGEAAPSITFDKQMHFPMSDGSTVVVEAGIYAVDIHGASHIRLVAERKPDLLLEAHAVKHTEKIDVPLAVTIPDENPNVVHVVLLLPDGQAFDAAGALSGTRTRGVNPALVTTALIQESVKQLGQKILQTPSDFDLAYCHAPIHYQDTNSSNYRADYITRFDYDGNMIAIDNWEHLTSFPLAAHAYYSVVETYTHWFITYGFFHPRDWSDEIFHPQEHENDMEGLLTIVRKDGTLYGRLEGMITVAHEDFYSYIPSGSSLRNGHETVDGALTMQAYDRSVHPLTNQEDQGHGIKAFPYAGNFLAGNGGDGIIYYPSRTVSKVPQSGNDRHVDYMLIDFFAPGGLWQRQLDEAPLSRNQAMTFAWWGTIKGDKKGGCGDGISRFCVTDSTHTPWAWDDHDDGPTYPPGEMALDPAHLAAHYFSGLGNFSMKYLRNRYASDLKACGYRHGNVPRGWPERINLDELFAKLTVHTPDQPVTKEMCQQWRQQLEDLREELSNNDIDINERKAILREMGSIRKKLQNPVCQP